MYLPFFACLGRKVAKNCIRIRISLSCLEIQRQLLQLCLSCTTATKPMFLNINIGMSHQLLFFSGDSIKHLSF